MEQMTEAKANAMREAAEEAVKKLNETFLKQAQDAGVDMKQIKGVSGLIGFDEANNRFRLNDGILGLVIDASFDTSTLDGQVKNLALRERIAEQQKLREAQGSVIQGL